MRAFAHSVAYLRAGNLAGLHAFGADVLLVHRAVLLDDGHLLDVRTEHTVGDAVRVADGTTRLRSLTANFANLRHNHSLHYYQISSGCKRKA